METKVNIKPGDRVVISSKLKPILHTSSIHWIEGDIGFDKPKVVDKVLPCDNCEDSRLCAGHIVLKDRNDLICPGRRAHEGFVRIFKLFNDKFIKHKERLLNEV